MHGIYGNVKKLLVIKPFDPWRSKLCTCRPKYSFHPYVGCSHLCLYCYASFYMGRRESVPKENLLSRLNKDLFHINRELFVAMSTSSDPYPPVEATIMATRRCLEVFAKHGLKILVVTKSDIVSRDRDLLLKTPSVVSVTITTLDPDLAQIIEPNAPDPYVRLETVKKLIENGIPTCVRVDPLIPGLNDKEEDIVKIVDKLSEIGVKHVVASTFKARYDSLGRLSKIFPDRKERWFRLYVTNGERIGGYMYLPREIRFGLLKRVIKQCFKRGLTVATCREGFGLELIRNISCDGQHLVNQHPLIKG